MAEYSIYSWNVNGVRAVIRKKAFSWVKKHKPTILALQETKASEEQVDEVAELQSYQSDWHAAEKKGYSGVATFYPKSLKAKSETSMGFDEFDSEGRVLMTKFKDFTLINCYFPNGKKNAERLDYKMRFYDAFLELLQELRAKGESLVICGDVNTAHKEIDLANPKPNSKYSGFLPEERKWIDKLLDDGFIDTYRAIHGDVEGAFTWWSMRTKTAKENNVGWRIDYFYISEDLKDNLKDASIYPDIEGSDHCPISISLEF
ncbi:MAG: exodeoxyribonuclease III [Candidatus Heimdallarchaeota archaeon]|nr:exodeoxyribonuclease III [Candidatus Heimdallarchaeota archaeon]